MFYLTFFFFVAAASQSEFPCTFPCDWINKTFSLYRDIGNGVFIYHTMTFNADGTTGAFTGILPFKCFQISEQFLMVTLQVQPGFIAIRCLAVFYTLGQSNFSLYFPTFNQKRIKNQAVAFNESQVWDICGLDTANMGSILALAPAPSEVPPAVCKVPSFCQSDSGAVCPQGGSIPKECTSKDTTTIDKTTTTTLAQSTTTTVDYSTTTRAKKPCGRRGRLHKHGQ
ncbi:unnamed protein product [Mytilus coruscus]|uniref:Uncharacterized protein n=1 Tax=Mytilus coruscus TaxID=42192 RepID=A0A6J8BQC9_MYTCO|nr:unnamed protein product [Mytilus coruscus]